MTRWPGYYDVVILPPPPVRDYAIELSRRLRRRGGRWTLGTRAFLPHISLYHIPVARENLDAFVEQLQRVAQTAAWGRLTTIGFDMPLLMLDKPAWLDALCRKVIARTAQFFDWDYGAEKKWSLRWFAGRRLQMAERYLQRYGTPMYGMNFRPHITLTVFDDPNAARDVKLPLRRMSFAVDRIHVCELGESHTCQRIVREIR